MFTGLTWTYGLDVFWLMKKNFKKNLKKKLLLKKLISTFRVSPIQKSNQCESPSVTGTGLTGPESRRPKMSCPLGPVKKRNP